jgi:hypothetical protein
MTIPMTTTTPGAMPLTSQLREYTPLVVYAKSYRLILLLAQGRRRL